MSKIFYRLNQLFSYFSILSDLRHVKLNGCHNIYLIALVFQICFASSYAMAGWDCSQTVGQWLSLYPAKRVQVVVVSYQDIRICARLKAEAAVTATLLGVPGRVTSKIYEYKLYGSDEVHRSWVTEGRPAEIAGLFGDAKYNWENGSVLSRDPVAWTAALPRCYLLNKRGNPQQGRARLNPAYGCRYNYEPWSGKKMRAENKCQFCGPSNQCECELYAGTPSDYDDQAAIAGTSAFDKAWGEQYSQAISNAYASCHDIKARLDALLATDATLGQRTRECPR